MAASTDGPGSTGVPIAHRLLFAACAAVVLAGGGGLVARGSGATSDPGPAGPPISAPSTTPASAPAAPPSTTPAVAVPSQATLEGDLIVPNDLGGYYQPVPADSGQQFAGSGCLAVLDRQPGVVRVAHQFLMGPYHGGLPIINESVSAYGRVSTAQQAYATVAAGLRSCPAPTVAIYGTGVVVPLVRVALNPLGDQAVGYRGGYQLHGHAEALTVALVRSGALIVVFVYADTVPESNPILGSVASTLSAVVGKTAS